MALPTTKVGLMINCALVVESKFSSRKSLIRDLEESHLVDNIIEARSVQDGFYQLESSEIDACLLGPALTPTAAENFVRQGREVLKNPSCAFIAVLEPGTSVLPALRKAGIDGTLTTPYQARTFSEVCNAAVEVARRRAGRLRSGLIEVGVAAKAKSPLSVTSGSAFSVALTEVAEKLREVSEKIAHGNLRLQPNGKPSLATQDAIRLALEHGFPQVSQVAQFGTFDHHFIAKVTAWFVSRISNSHEEATDELRQALNAYPPQYRR